MNRPIILFRFHARFEICRERLELLAALNPGVPIYGLYGGSPEAFASARSVLGDLVADLRPADPHDAMWHWLHVDLDVKQWYRSYGHSVDFDVLFDYEWDLLTTAPLGSIIPPLDPNTLALCSLSKLTPDLESRWHWTSYPEHRVNYERYLDYMRGRFGMGALDYVSHGPGPVLPRRFLERFAELEDVEFTISEITYPAYAQVLGFGLVNNGFHLGSVIDHSEDGVFNSEPDLPIAYEAVVSETFNPAGRRAFHPVKYSFSKDRLRRLERQRAVAALADRWLPWLGTTRRFREAHVSAVRRKSETQSG